MKDFCVLNNPFLENLNGLPRNIDSLYVSNNRLKSLKSLKFLKNNIRQIIASYNEIESFDLDDMGIVCENLYVSHNPLLSLKGIPRVTGVIDVSFTHLPDILNSDYGCYGSNFWKEL